MLLIRKWQNQLNEHIFEKPLTITSKSKSLMTEIDDLIAQLRPCKFRHNFSTKSIAHWKQLFFFYFKF